MAVVGWEKIKQNNKILLAPAYVTIEIFDDKKCKYASLWACKCRFFHEYLYFDIQLYYAVILCVRELVYRLSGSKMFLSYNILSNGATLDT